MGRELSDSQLRRLRIKRQSQNPFGANFSTEVRSPRNLRLVSNSKDNELHHNRIVDVFEPFFVRNDAENLATVDHLAQRGIYIGNNDKNLQLQYLLQIIRQAITAYIGLQSKIIFKQT